MSTFHGDCVGPVGAKLYHSLCPHAWTSRTTGRVYFCECFCHDIVCSECGGETVKQIDMAEPLEWFGWCESCAVSTFAGEAAEAPQTHRNAVSRPELDTSEGFPLGDSPALREAPTCPRCRRPWAPWPVKRADLCSPPEWVKCIRPLPEAS